MFYIKNIWKYVKSVILIKIQILRLWSKCDSCVFIMNSIPETEDDSSLDSSIEYRTQDD